MGTKDEDTGVYEIPKSWLSLSKARKAARELDEPTAILCVGSKRDIPVYAILSRSDLIYILEGLDNGSFGPVDSH